MNCVRVGDLMVPLNVYGTVFEESSLHDSMLAFGKAKRRPGAHENPDAVFVVGRDQKIVGRIDLWNLLRAIEPKYSELKYPREITDSECCSGCKFADSIRTIYGTWTDTLDKLCSGTPKASAKEIMHPLSDMEFIEESASLEEALNRLVVGHLESLLVTRGREVVGVLRMSNAVGEIIGRLESCQISFSEQTPDAEAA